MIGVMWLAGWCLVGLAGLIAVAGVLGGAAGLVIALGIAGAVAVCALFCFGFAMIGQELQSLRREMSHRAENDIKMFNANRQAAGLPPL